MSIRVRLPAVLAAAALIPLATGARPALAASGGSSPVVLHVGQIASQDVAPRPGSETDTLVEPDVAISPTNPDVMVAAAHDGRYATGGAVDISYSWTGDGGATWHHAPMPHLTTATGGVWDRASDPVVAFDAVGDVYISVLVFDVTSCNTGVVVSRSTDGGATFGDPVVVQTSSSCNYSDDKDWLSIDTRSGSPHRGRLYEFWTAFLVAGGRAAGSPQVLRWSDDDGATWSGTTVVTGAHENSQGSQPMIEPDGTIVDVYYGPGSSIVGRTSHDGGATWGAESVVVPSPESGFGPRGIRCCLFAGTADPVTGKMLVAWEGRGLTDPVELASSADGQHWSAPLVVSGGGPSGSLDHVNVTVTAYGGRVFVSYGVRNTAAHNGELIQQEVSSSYDAGATFGAPLRLGIESNLRYAAFAGGKFPGDYIGASATATRVVLVWCVSSTPADPSLEFNQNLYAAVLRP